MDAIPRIALAPLIDQVRKLLQARQGAWSAERDAGVRLAFARALVDYGYQKGDSNALRESIQTYRDALKEYTRERVPLDWAMTQNNLGNALRTLGRARERHGAAGGGGRPPIATRCRNGRASACRSTGR